MDVTKSEPTASVVGAGYKEITVKFSRFCHICKNPGEWIFYHSLNFAIVRCEAVMAQKITGLDLSQLITDRKLEEKIEEFIKAKLIVSSEKEDEVMLKSAQDLIREPYITTAYFFITNHCNLACRYCFEKQSVPSFFKKESMGRETALQGLRFFSSLMNKQPERFHEKKTIIFYGGEPLMNRDVLRYTIETIREFIMTGDFPSGTKIIVVTNGTLLNEEDIGFFLRHKVTLTFSIDGDDAATANRVYPDGNPAFGKISESYMKCRDAGLDLNIACTLTPASLQRMEESLRYFIEDLKIRNIGFNVLLDNGLINIPKGYDEAAADFVVRAGQILKTHHIGENRTGRRMQVFNKKQPCIFDCNAQGGRQIAIAPGGEVGICHEHITDRNYFVTTVFDDFDPATDPVYREWNRRTPLHIEKCLDCRALGICGGGCVINTERAAGTIWLPDPRFCMQTIKILDSLLQG